MAAYLYGQRFVIGLDRQQEVGPPLLKVAEKWLLAMQGVRLDQHALQTSSPRSCLSTARSWFSPVA